MKTQGLFSLFTKFVLIPIAVLALLLASVRYLVPVLLPGKLVDIVEQSTGRKTTVGKIDFHLLPLQLNLHDFAMLELNGQPFANFAELALQINTWQSLSQSALVIENIALVKPNVHITRLKDGAFNFKDLAKPSSEPKPENNSVFPFQVVKLNVSEGKLTWQDDFLPKPVQEVISPINLDITGLASTANQLADENFSLAMSSGVQLNWQSKTGINPVVSTGKIKLEHLQLDRLKTLSGQELPVNLQGNALIDIDYELSKTATGTALNLKQSTIQLSDLQLADTANNMQVKIPNIALTGSYDLHLEQAVSLAIKQSKLAITGLQLDSQAQGNMQVQLPLLSLEGDYDLQQAEKNLTLKVNNSQLALQELQFTGNQPGRIVVKAPILKLTGQYELSKVDQLLDVSVNNSEFLAQNLQLAEQGQNTALVKIPEIAVQGINLNLNKQQLSIASVATKDAEVKSWLDKQGVLNFQALFAGKPAGKSAPAHATPATTTAEPQTKPWQIKVDNFSANNFGLNFEDRSLAKPTTMTVKPITVKVSNYSNNPGTKLPFQVNLGINKKGTVAVNGTGIISPLSADINVAVKNIELENLQPYVDKFARVDIIDGLFHVDGKLALANTKQDKLGIKFTGNTGITDLLTRDQLKNKDLVKWKDLTLKNVSADVLANKYSAASLEILKPYVRVVISKEKRVNFQDIVPAKTNTAPTPATAVKTTAKPAATTTSQAAPTSFKLDKLKIIDGSSDFADLSLILPFAAQIKSLDGGASGISSDKQANIKVDLKGNAYDLAPVSISGDIKPYQGNYDISLNFDGMPMPLISPYMVQFAGYKVEKGKLTIALNYQVSQAQLTASNKILIDQLELGEKVENPNAVSIPLDLAITLLKDADGKIKIDVPITGSLEDPQFSIGHIVVDALVNVITKVITSPFRALASLIGSEEDLSTIIFAAGSADLPAAQTVKLDNLVKALTEKSTLNLNIKGTAFQDQDWPQLNDDALYDQIRAIRADEINKKGGRQVRPENVELSQDDYNRILAGLFMQKFPGMAEKSLFGTYKLVPPDAGDFYAVAKQKLSDSIKPEPQRLKDLAVERAKTIAKYLVQKGKIPNERVYILDVVLDPPRENTDIASILSLKTN